MKHLNKDPDGSDSSVQRIRVKIRDWMKRNGRAVHDQMIRGASYSLGSGAVSLLIVWFEARH
ncbi:hypothetical protein SO3561_08919 [Streptomyces olivochromogenes]|uniref:Uncharacterized protein n=1 Tax=Streptomyces olivochromogenes TaxID=1963 RepID=A0A250VTD0_STROL|nr:hypothetical protein SO3561_08919 [Streptomyces olivochromogenes]